MPILHDPASRSFLLHAGECSYAMQVAPTGHLLHRHWGRRISDLDLAPLGEPLARAFSPNPDPAIGWFSLDTSPQEVPAGNGDFRLPAIEVELADGARGLDLRYQEHRIEAGKPAIPGQPATYVEAPGEAETLTIVLADARSGIQVHLRYTAFAAHGAIARSTVVVNRGAAPAVLTGVASASVDLVAAEGEVITLDGAWSRERFQHRTHLRPGLTQVQSRRGTSSHQHNPFIALCDARTGEEHGEVRALSLVYSGNHRMAAEQDAFGSVRLMAGILPETFRWTLDPGASFHAPECILAFSAAGLGGLSRTLHRLYRTRLCRGPWRDRRRPVLLNNWEGTYFDFTTDRLVAMARAARDLGIELFVLDDGWFGVRDNDRSGLGDWVVNERKLPGGLKRVADEVTSLGMTFGLWFEPEMVSPDSDLYRAHPDWCLHLPGRPRQESRQQLVLDLTRQEVRDHVMDQVIAVMRSADIGYVKWDMNRHLDALWSTGLPAARQGEVAHRFVLAVYEMHQRLLDACPGLLLEGCSGGGGRFDPGMLFYAPQIWTSDNTDAHTRLDIQAGSTLVYPLSSLSAHVSAVPNHQHHRTTPLETRFAVAATGSFGLELDPTRFTAEERAAVIPQVAEYKRLQPLLHSGDLYRLADDRRRVAWQVVSPDRRESLVTAVGRLGESNLGHEVLRLAGLDPAARYLVSELHGERRVRELAGDTLMHAGLQPVAGLVWNNRDFIAQRWLLERVG